jgi:hypothetical protein
MQTMEPDFTLAPVYHPLKTMFPTSVVIDKPYHEVVPFILNAFTSLGIGYVATEHCVYKCSYLINHELLWFYVRLYRNNGVHEIAGMHVVEFKQISGDRFDYAGMLSTISDHLAISIPGSRRFNSFDEVDFSMYEEIKASLTERLSAESPRDLQLDGLLTVGACSRDIAKITIQTAPTFFGSDGIWSDIAHRVVDITRRSFEDDKILCLTGVSVLANIMKVPASWDSAFLTEVSMIADMVQSVEGELAIHFKAEALKLNV